MKRLWIRLYTSVVHDPKVQLLPDPLFKFWINCLCLAGLHDGCLPTEQELAFSCRFPDPKLVGDLLGELEDRHLVHHVGGKIWKVHDWQEYQYDSDSSTERVKRFRNVPRNVSETLDETHQSRAEAEQSRTESIREQASRSFSRTARARKAEKPAAAAVAAARLPAPKPNGRPPRYGDVLEEAIHSLLEEGVAIPERTTRNQYGRPETNPARRRLEELLRSKEDKIRAARKPIALARKIILDEIKGA